MSKAREKRVRDIGGAKILQDGNRYPVPVGYRLLVRPSKPPEKSRGGIIIAQDAQFAMHHLQHVGQVVAMGPDAYQHPKFRDQAWCEVGDHVVYGTYTGQEITICGSNADPGLDSRGRLYVRFVNDDQIVARIESPDDVFLYCDFIGAVPGQWNDMEVA